MKSFTYSSLIGALLASQALASEGDGIVCLNEVLRDMLSLLNEARD